MSSRAGVGTAERQMEDNRRVRDTEFALAGASAPARLRDGLARACRRAAAAGAGAICRAQADASGSRGRELGPARMGGSGGRHGRVAVLDRCGDANGQVRGNGRCGPDADTHAAQRARRYWNDSARSVRPWNHGLGSISYSFRGGGEWTWLGRSENAEAWTVRASSVMKCGAYSRLGLLGPGLATRTACRMFARRRK